MQSYFHNLSDWQNSNEQLLAQLPKETRQQLIDYEVRLYPSAGFAVLDAFYGLKSLFTFKKNALFFKNQDPFIDAAARALAMQGMAMKSLDLSLLDDSKKIQLELNNSLNKESCFIAYSTSDPLLNRYWPIQDLESVLSDKNLPRIRLDYHHRLEIHKNLDRNTVHIVGLKNSYVASVLGERVRFRSHFAPLLPQLSKVDESLWPEAKTLRPDFKVFLEQIAPDFTALLSEQQMFESDRIAVFSEKIDGSALIELLKKTDPALYDAPEALLMTPSLSSWGGLNTMDWLKEWGLDLKKIRGTIIVDQKIISDKFIGEFIKSYRSLLELQNGDQR